LSLFLLPRHPTSLSSDYWWPCLLSCYDVNSD
jgi:hypothetical protein